MSKSNTRKPDHRYKNPDYHHEYRKANREAINARHRRYKQEKAAYIRSLKNYPCQDCGNSFDPICMDFHHVSGIKERDVSQMKNMSYQAIWEEIEKCVLLCANCHRLRHSEGCFVRSKTTFEAEEAREREEGEASNDPTPEETILQATQ